MRKKYNIAAGFIHICGWMRTDLHLTSKRLMAYAIIYGYSIDGDHEYKGSIGYIAEFIGCSKPTAIKALASLVDEGFILKRQELINGLWTNRFMINFKRLPSWLKVTEPVKKPYLLYKETLPITSKETLPITSKETLHKNRTIGNKPLRSKEEEKQRMQTDESVVDASPVLTLEADAPKAEKKSSAKRKEDRTDEAVEVLEFFNRFLGRDITIATSGRGSKNVTNTANLLRKGYDVDTLKNVIIFKATEWKGNAKMKKYLEVDTLFKTQGEKYAEQVLEIMRNPARLADFEKAKLEENRGKMETGGAIDAEMAEILANF